MTLTVFLARFFGFYIAIMGTAMVVRRAAMMKVMTAIVDQRPLIFFLAMLRVLIGLALVLVHTRWSGSLEIIVTLIGWITLIRGVALLLLPESAERKTLALLDNGWRFYSVSAIAIAFGLWLTYAAAQTARAPHGSAVTHSVERIG